jgi:hypothetical protein
MKRQPTMRGRIMSRPWCAPKVFCQCSLRFGLLGKALTVNLPKSWLDRRAFRASSGRLSSADARTSMKIVHISQKVV